MSARFGISASQNSSKQMLSFQDSGFETKKKEEKVDLDKPFLTELESLENIESSVKKDNNDQNTSLSVTKKVSEDSTATMSQKEISHSESIII